jgi:ferredoxin
MIDLADCSRCAACVDAYPHLFRMSDAGFIEVIGRDTYPEDDVEEAIKYCPEDCIHWEDE